MRLLGLLVLASACGNGSGSASSDAPQGTSDVAPSSGSDATAVARPPYNTGVGFYVGTDHKLYDAAGVEFRIRGVNRLHYDDASGPYIPMSGANAERWTMPTNRDAALNVTQFQSQNIDHAIVPIPGIWDVSGHTLTCGSDTAQLVAAVDYWVANASTYKGIERYAIINIANEWGPGSGSGWRDAYIDAISRMRAAGYLGTLLVDAGGCGQASNNIIDDGKAVFDSDPQKNVVLSFHLYGGTTDSAIASRMEALVATGLPVVIGEFGPGRNIGPSPTDATPLHVIAGAEAAGLGWLAWAWDDNNLDNCMSDDNWFSMTKNCGVYNGGADLTLFGTDVVLDPSYGLKALAKPATVFAP